MKNSYTLNWLPVAIITIILELNFNISRKGKKTKTNRYSWLIDSNCWNKNISKEFYFPQ